MMNGIETHRARLRAGKPLPRALITQIDLARNRVQVQCPYGETAPGNDGNVVGGHKHWVSLFRLKERYVVKAGCALDGEEWRYEIVLNSESLQANCGRSDRANGVSDKERIHNA